MQIGVLRDYIPKIMQKYWDYIVKGGIAENDGKTLIVKKIDCFSMFDFDFEALQTNVKKLNAGIKLLPVSAKNEAGMEQFFKEQVKL